MLSEHAGLIDSYITILPVIIRICLHHDAHGLGKMILFFLHPRQISSFLQAQLVHLLDLFLSLNLRFFRTLHDDLLFTIKSIDLLVQFKIFLAALLLISLMVTIDLEIIEFSVALVTDSEQIVVEL